MILNWLLVYKLISWRVSLFASHLVLQMEKSKYLCDGLPTGDILISEIREEVLEATVCRYFGPKSSKSGWKYSLRTTEEEQRQILCLYRRVYEANEPPNKEITLSFARGLILMSLGQSVNWAQFAAERRKVREALKKKSEDRREKREREREDGERNGRGSLSAPSVLGKKRCTVGREDIGLPGSLSLSVKSEGVGEGLVMAKKTGPKSARTTYGPCWSRDEVESMSRSIEFHEGLAQECKSTLVDSREECSAIEDKLRREKLLLSDRQLMLNEVTLRLSQISEGEIPLRHDVESKTWELAELEVKGDLGSQAESEVVRKDIAALSTRRDALFFKRSLEELTAWICREAIVECTAQITELQDALRTSSESLKETECTVQSLEKVLLSMHEQLHKMHAGDGAVFYPRPLDSCPQRPVVRSHTLNACPVCTLWYDCFHYFSLGCGHTYHPYSLHQLVQTSSECLVPHCRETFATRSLVAIGIRPVARADLCMKVMHPAAKEVAATISGTSLLGQSPMLSFSLLLPVLFFFPVS